VNEFFETSNKKSKRRPPGRFIRGLRAIFNLVLVLGVSAAVGISCLYLFVLREYENDLDRTYPELAENSYVYDVDGNKLGEIPVAERRETVGFEGLGTHLPGPRRRALRPTLVPRSGRRLTWQWATAPSWCNGEVALTGTAEGAFLDSRL
jgi:hypothetical protein